MQKKCFFRTKPKKLLRALFKENTSRGRKQHRKMNFGQLCPEGLGGGGVQLWTFQYKSLLPMSHNQRGMKDTLRDDRVDWPTMEDHRGTSGPASSPTNNKTIVRMHEIFY